MPSRDCKGCHQKKANRPGTFCDTCWRAAGKPSAEEMRQRRLAERNQAVLADLSDERTDDLAAMEHVREGKPVTTRQQHWFQRMLEAEGPAKFQDRIQRLRSGQAPSPLEGEGGEEVVPPTWDGSGPCPTCHRPPDRAPDEIKAELRAQLPAELADLTGWLAERGIT